MRHGTIAVFAVSLLILAGCSSTTLTGPSISEPRVEVYEDEGPVLIFNYSVDDYRTVLLEGPNGRVINEDTLEPEKRRDGLAMGNPEPGTYKLIIQRDGETVRTKEVHFEGAVPRLVDVSAQWSGNTVEQVSVIIRNAGDLPLRLTEATYSVRGERVEIGPLYHWIPAGESQTLALESSFGRSISITKPGEVRGRLRVQTSNGTLSGSFSKTFEGANVEVVDVDQRWSGARMDSVAVVIQNTGDLPTTANVSIQSGGEVYTRSRTQTLAVGESTRISLSPFGGILKATRGGVIEVGLIVDSPSGFVTETISHEVEPAQLSLQSIQPEWHDGELESVKYTLENTGEVEGSFDATLTINGEKINEMSRSLQGGLKKSFEFASLFGSLGRVTSGGQYNVTVTIVGPQGTESKTVVKEFAGPEGSISAVSTSFYGNYGEDTSDLSSVTFSVRNSGDVVLTYDAIRLSIEGVSRTDGLYSATELAQGESTSEIVTLIDAITVSNGQHQLTIELLNDGDVVVRETVTVSTDS